MICAEFIIDAHKADDLALLTNIQAPVKSQLHSL